MPNLPRRQQGAIPLIVVVALALSAVAGGFVGFQLGDGSLFSFGVGFGIVFFIVILLQPRITAFLKALRE